MSNRIYFQDVVKGNYGRKIAYVDEDVVTINNVLAILSETIGVFWNNRHEAEYLWRYKNGDQPILYRQKTIRDDVCNNVVENRAYEIVEYSVSQTYGEPLQYVSISKDNKVTEAVDKLNDIMRAAFKYQRNIVQGEWKVSTGTSFLAVQSLNDSENPFRIIVPTPMNTFIVYSSYTNEPLLAVQVRKDENKEQYFMCYSENMEFLVKNGKVVSNKLHAFGGIPIVEVPNNQDRLSDIELVISMLDAINNMQSNRMDAVEQFVQFLMVFTNCQIDSEQFEEMKRRGALKLKSNNGDNKAGLDILSQELNQSESQIAKDDLWDGVQSILAIPNRAEKSSGGDRQGATYLKGGWDFAKQRANLKDCFVKEAEMRFVKVVLNVLRVAEKGLDISVNDFEVNIPHSPQDNLVVKTQALQYLLSCGIHPFVAIKTVGLWSDSEKVYLQSKPYLDAIYQTIDEKIKENDLQSQESEAKALLDKYKEENEQ